MRVANVGTYPLTIGAIIAIVVLIVAVLIMIGIAPTTPVVVGACLAGLAVARLT
jgi:hypothetical protein